MFLPTGAQNLYALNAKSGAIVWQYSSGGSGSGGRHWGVALGEGFVFLPQRDTRILALEERTGKVVWSHKLADENEKGPVAPSLNSAPTYAQGVVITGLQSGDAGIRGRVVALDARTGAEVWRFHTVPGPDEIGHDTWPKGGDAWKRGGAAVWHSPAVDVNLGLVYFNTGNPWQSYVGENRAGDNLFSVSVVALDLRTGKYRWHFQLIHHDIWDWDAPNPVVLFDTVVNGRPRKGIAEVRTDGYLFMLDRETGVPLFPVEERPVKQEPRQRTAATQPFPVGAEQIVPNCVQPDMIPPGFVLGCEFDPVWSDQPNVMVPTFGPRHAPFSYSPQTGYFYIVSSVLPRWIFRNESPPSGGFRLVPGTKHYGLLTAVDSRTQKIAWQKRLPHHAAFGSGTIVTAGGLVFHGEPDGRVEAYRATDGERLWQFQTEFGADGPLATYEVDGDQFVALAAGGNVYNFSANGDAVWAFKLNGMLQPQVAPSPPPSTVAVTGELKTGTQVALGGPRDDAIVPVRLRARLGERVTWTNNGQEAHTAVARDGTWRTSSIAPGSSVAIVFDKPGSHVYFCSEHPWAIGEIVVGR
jgi:PQQ-dependent dehydrogenase (methanol/ethanol family)